MVFKLTNSYDDETHHFRVYEVASPDDDNWLQLLAEEYLRLLTDWDTFNTNIQRIKERNDSTLNLPTSGIMKYITELSIPERSDDNFDVVRSDFGEILGYTLLEREYRTLFGPKSICERELRDRPGRGIDTVGIEPGDPLTLILCEAKVSDETQSPPQVVDYKPDCLKKQHLQHIKNENKKNNSENSTSCDSLKRSRDLFFTFQCFDAFSGTTLGSFAFHCM